MRLLTQKRGNLLLHFDFTDEGEVGINTLSLKQIPNVNHTEANRRNIRGVLPLKCTSGFCNKFQERTKGLGFELELKTSKKRDILYTLPRDETVNVTTSGLSHYVPTIIPSQETFRTFKEANTKSFTLSFESWTFDKKPLNTGKQFQLDIISESKINAPLYLIAAHHKTNA